MSLEEILADSDVLDGYETNAGLMLGDCID
jgi:hypothetical protein